MPKTSEDTVPPCSYTRTLRLSLVSAPPQLTLFFPYVDKELRRIRYHVSGKNWGQMVVQNELGWVASAWIERRYRGHLVPAVFVASLPRQTQDQAEGELLGLLFQVFAKPALQSDGSPC